MLHNKYVHTKIATYSMLLKKKTPVKVRHIKTCQKITV